MNVVLRGPEDLPSNLKKERTELNIIDEKDSMKEEREQNKEEEDEDEFDLIFEEDYEHEYLTNEIKQYFLIVSKIWLKSMTYIKIESFLKLVDDYMEYGIINGV